MYAACRFDHDIKGQGIYAYVSMAEDGQFTDKMKKELSQVVRKEIGAFAVPDVIHWAPGQHPMQQVSLGSSTVSPCIPVKHKGHQHEMLLSILLSSFIYRSRYIVLIVIFARHMLVLLSSF